MEGFDYNDRGGRKSQRQVSVENSNPDDLGIIPNAVNEVFSQIRSYSESKHFTVFVSFLQIYNEKVFDLLNEHQSYKGKGLRIRWSKQEQFTVENLYVFECENED